MATKRRGTDLADMKSKKSVDLTSAAERPAKRLKGADSSQLKRLAVEARSERVPVKSTRAKSVLNLEEKAFPRGGASVLTPLEHKQIQNEAFNDVLFEQSGNARPPREDIDIEDNSAEQTGGKGGKKRSRSKGTKPGAAKPEEPRIPVEGLSFKRLTPGSLVLAQVVGITSRDVALALPNNLTGFVGLSAISPQISAQSARLAAAEEATKHTTQVIDELDDFKDVDLHKIFEIGRFLRVCVLSNGSEEVGKQKRHIELATTPSLVNQGLTRADLITGNVVQASIHSVEDHGAVMDIGLEGEDVKAFLSFEDLNSEMSKEDLEEGTVLLCRISQTQAKGKILKLSTSLSPGTGSSIFLSTTSTVNAFLPGTPIEFLITDVSRSDVRGKLMGMIDVTADHLHSGHPTSEGELTDLYKIGAKAKGRILFKLSGEESQRLGVSVLEDIVQLSTGGNLTDRPGALLTPSSTVEAATVKKVDRKLGLFMDVGVQGHPGFAHISRLSDKRIESLDEDSGAFRVGSTHRARVLGFNPVDGLFNLSLEATVLSQPFLRIEDVKVGEIVKGKVERIVVNARGVGGILVNLAEGITGLVPEMHMADVQLQHPDRKFREGMSVTARVLSTDLDRRNIRLTLKKTLVNSDVKPWSRYEELVPGDRSPGTIVSLVRDGAVIQFYGDVRGFLPVSEMSETYIKDPSEHFRVGQVVQVHILEVDIGAKRLRVSCKDVSAQTKAQRQAFADLQVGQIVSATVTAISEDNAALLLDSGVNAVLKLEQFTDGSEKKNLAAIKKIRASQKLTDLVVLQKVPRFAHVLLTNKPSLVKAARNGSLVKTVADLQAGREVQGFIRNITASEVFVEFAAGLVGLLHRSQIADEATTLPGFGMHVGQSVSALVLNVDEKRNRFTLTQKETGTAAETPAGKPAGNNQDRTERKDAHVVNPVDGRSTTLADFALGMVTKARIRHIKSTQLNVLLADNVQGRIDVTEAFDDFSTITDHKTPLESFFKQGDVVDVKILGLHDSRNHRFLPLSHRQGTNPVFELSAKKSRIQGDDQELLAVDKVHVGSTYTAFVNNITDRSVFVSLSPQVRSRIDFLELSNDAKISDRLDIDYPVGSALQVIVKAIDPTKNSVELTARTTASAPISYNELKKGMILPARVTKTTERYIMIQLRDGLSGQIPLTDIADDFDEAKPDKHHKNDLVRACVTQIDTANKKVMFSIRPSHTLSSSLPVKDRHIENPTQLKVNDVVRGFIRNVADIGLFVSLGPEVTAFVKVGNLSDTYVKDWKSQYQVDQLVRGKIIEIDPANRKVMMSLKPSHLSATYVPPMTWQDLRKGQIVAAAVRKVEDFGVFIVVENSNNVSGLCHRSEIADQRVEDVKKLYEVGDRVKAIVLKVEMNKRRAAFGLKASYFVDEDGMEVDGVSDVDDEDDDDEEEDGGVELVLSDDSDGDDDEVADIDLENVQDFEGEDGSEDEAIAITQATGDRFTSSANKPVGLSAGTLDWSGDAMMDAAHNANGYPSDTESVIAASKKKRKNRTPQITVDRTGDLDAFGPRSESDFERLLLGQPNDSTLWIQYMAFQLGLSEVEKARETGERALRTIHIRESEEKRNVWVALLNLEVSFGEDEDRIKEVFERACQYNDRGEMHEKLAGIYIESGKIEKADELFQSMLKIKSLTAQPAFWLNYATFLLSTKNDPTSARQLLARATQSVPANEHRNLTAKFGLLEFTSGNGDKERGRTVFEGLLAAWPRRWDLWDMFVDAEVSLLTKDATAAPSAPVAVPGKKSKKQKVANEDLVSAGSVEQTRDLFSRMSKAKMRPRRAKYVFKRWMEFENRFGDVKSVKNVEGVAREWVEQHAKSGDVDDGEE